MNMCDEQSRNGHSYLDSEDAEANMDRPAGSLSNMPSDPDIDVYCYPPHGLAHLFTTLFLRFTFLRGGMDRD